MMERNEKSFHILEIAIHLMTWMVFFFFPQRFFVREDGFSDTFAHLEPFLLSIGLLIIGFYINYFWIVPRMLKTGIVRHMVLINTCYFIILQVTSVVWDTSAHAFHQKENLNEWEMPYTLPCLREGQASCDSFHCPLYKQNLNLSCKIEDLYNGQGTLSASPKPSLPEQKNFLAQLGVKTADKWGPLFSLGRNFLVYTLLVLLCLVLRMAFRFRQEEMARKQAELKQTETELQSLRNQISPHFLLNTLNNIYALIIMDQAKAQEAIINLSRLLSRMLYHERDRYVTLEREVDFLRSYVDLMQLRISQSVDVRFDTLIDNCRQMTIAPYILVSLVENAFKHGIRGNQGYIHVHIQASDQIGVIKAEIRNSNYPKSHDDKSGHGVGLAQVQRRLDLVYPDRYVWNKGVDTERNEYYSILTIHTK